MAWSKFRLVLGLTLWALAVTCAAVWQGAEATAPGKLPPGFWLGLAVGFTVAGAIALVSAAPWLALKLLFRRIVPEPTVRVHFGTPALRLPLDKNGYGAIEIHGMCIHNGLPETVSYSLQVAYYLPTGFHDPGCFHVSGPESVKAPPGRLYLRPLKYLVGLCEEDAYWMGVAKIWFHGSPSILPVRLFDSSSPNPRYGIHANPTIPPEAVTEWKSDARTFRDSTDVIWQGLKAWFDKNSRGSSGLQAVVVAAPWPDVRGPVDEMEKFAGDGLAAFCDEVCTQHRAEIPPINRARRDIAGIVEKWSERIRSTDGLVPWLRKELDWPIRPAALPADRHTPLHSPTLKLTWYFGLAVAREASHDDPNYQPFAELRDALDGKDFMP